jgi:NTP pyrophosphatase (non-canonical NTP hydrolase)
MPSLFPPGAGATPGPLPAFPVFRRHFGTNSPGWCHQNGPVDLIDLQARMGAVYGERDRARGLDSTVAWLAEEVGELARAVRKGTPDEQLHELGDVLAWLASLADQLGLSLDEAAGRYAGGCPKCGATPCTCP